MPYGETAPVGLDLANVQPVDDRVLLERIQDDESEVIIVPDVAKKLTHKGKVLRCGPGKLDKKLNRHPLDVKPGDVVVFQSFDTQTDSHILIQEADILFILEEVNAKCQDTPTPQSSRL